MVFELTADSNQEEWSTAEFVDCKSCSDGDDQIQNCLSSTQSKLLILVGDASALVDGVHVVGEQGIARVLRDYAQRDDDSQPPAVTLGTEKIHVAGGSGGLFLNADCLLNLLELVLNRSVLSITAGVQIGENLESFVGTVFVDQESRRLGNPCSCVTDSSKQVADAEINQTN